MSTSGNQQGLQQSFASGTAGWNPIMAASSLDACSIKIGPIRQTGSSLLLPKKRYFRANILEKTIRIFRRLRPQGRHSNRPLQPSAVFAQPVAMPSEEPNPEPALVRSTPNQYRNRRVAQGRRRTSLSQAWRQSVQRRKPTKSILSLSTVPAANELSFSGAI